MTTPSPTPNRSALPAGLVLGGLVLVGVLGRPASPLSHRLLPDVAPPPATFAGAGGTEWTGGDPTADDGVPRAILLPTGSAGRAMAEDPLRHSPRAGFGKRPGVGADLPLRPSDLRFPPAPAGVAEPRPLVIVPVARLADPALRIRAPPSARPPDPVPTVA